MSITKPILSILHLAAAACCLASGVAHARPLPHNQVQSIRQDVTDYQWRFQPMLRVENGCVPFPAVDWHGNTNGGLKPTGSESGKCSRSSGQVYVRAGYFSGDCAVMYAWYFPKDQRIAGHRHDWENIIVWLSSCSMGATVNAVSYSAHGKYKTRRGYIPMWNWTHPKVNYGADGVMNHSLSPTEQGGGWQPAIRWYGLSGAARHALETTAFGAALVPMSDENFLGNLRKAWYR